MAVDGEVGAVPGRTDFAVGQFVGMVVTIGL